MKKIRWGILGCGKIARKFAADLQLANRAELIAVAARQRSSARAFANDFPAHYVHGNYEDLVTNPDVDVIYVATPHGLHHEHVLLCLKHKKAVLCEKAFALNYRQASEMIAFAKAQNTFLMEAFWTRLLPHYLLLKQLIADGKAGTIKYISAEFGFKAMPPFPQRLYDPMLGGGALLDIGVYPVFLALDILGTPDRIEATMTPAGTGVDEQCAIHFYYNNGAIAQLFCTFAVNLATGVDVAGDQGRIRLAHRFHGPVARLEYYPDATDVCEYLTVENAKGNGYEYEIRHVTECLSNNLKESPVLTHENTLRLMRTLDAIRAKAGIRYPVD